MSVPAVEFTFEYAPLLAGRRPREAVNNPGPDGSEVYPVRIDVHGTHQLAHQHLGTCPRCVQVTQIVIESPSDSHKFNVRVERHRATSAPGGMMLPYYEAGAYEEALDVAVSPDDTSVAASASVMLHVFATTYAETGQQCWANAGTAVVPVAMIAGGTSSETVEVVQNRDNDAASKHNHPLLKGHMKLSEFRVVGVSLRAPTQYDIYARPERADQVAEQMSGIIDRGMLAFFGSSRAKKNGYAPFLANSTKPFLRPFHCPEFRTDRMPLPASAYSMLLPSGDLCIDYYEQLMEVGLARSGLTRDQAFRFGTAVMRRDTTVATHQRAAFASFCVRALSANAVSQVYLDDFLNRNVGRTGWDPAKVEGDEDFKVCRLCGGDDCEGCALEVHMAMRELTRAPDSLVSDMSPLLALVRSFLRLFMSTLTLGAVTNKKLTAAQLDQNSVMAHTFAVFVPFWQFYSSVGSEAVAYLERSRFFRERRDELEAFRDADLTALVGEGTAPIDPAMRPVSSYYDDASEQVRRLALQAAEARRTLTKTIVEVLETEGEACLSTECFGAPDRADSDYSPFYKFPVSLAAPDLADLRTLDWALVYQRDTPKSRSFGIEFGSLVDPAQANKYGPAQLMPFLDLKEEEARLIDAVLLDQQPIPVLRAPGEGYTSVEQARWAPQLPQKAGEAGAGTVLHQRRLFLTIRARDISEKTVRALQRIANLKTVKALETRWWSLNMPVDGTKQVNTVLDIYVAF